MDNSHDETYVFLLLCGLGGLLEYRCFSKYCQAFFLENIYKSNNLSVLKVKKRHFLRIWGRQDASNTDDNVNNVVSAEVLDRSICIIYTYVNSGELGPESDPPAESEEIFQPFVDTREGISPP